MCSRVCDVVIVSAAISVIENLELLDRLDTLWIAMNQIEIIDESLLHNTQLTVNNSLPVSKTSFLPSHMFTSPHRAFLCVFADRMCWCFVWYFPFVFYLVFMFL